LKRALLIPVSIALLLALSGCGTAVPDVRGMNTDAAAQTLVAAGFQARAVGYDAKAPQAPGTVLTQDPAAGRRARQGAGIGLTIAGAPPVAVPNLADLDAKAAKAALVAAGLRAGTVSTAHSDTVKDGKLVSQNPAAGAQAPGGSAVQLVFSTGAQPRSVPNVKGRSEARARERLEEDGFKVRVKRAGGPKDKGIVIAQSPSGGEAPLGATVTITVSTGNGGTTTGGGDSSAGGSANDAAAKRAFETQATNLPLQGQGTVTRVLTDDNDGDRHQRFILKLGSGQTLLIAHNIDIAPRLPGLAAGDSVAFSGIYEWSAQGGTVHWTHHDPSGDHAAGWLAYKGDRYQ